MSALKIGNVLRAGLMAWAMFMDLNVRSGDNYVNIGQSLVGTSGAVALAAPLAQSTRIFSPARSDSMVEATKSM